MKIRRKMSKFILQNYLILADYSAPDTYGEATSHEDRTAAKRPGQRNGVFVQE